VNRINPDQHPVHLQKLLAHLAGDIVSINRRLRLNAERGQLLEDPMEAIVRGRRVATGLGISTPKRRHLGRFHAGHLTLHLDRSR
jgi:hypothetical protein